MCTNRVLGSVAFLVFSLAQVATGQVVVELVPDNPGPYAGGEAITVNVWLHSSLKPTILGDPRLGMIQLDFSQADPSLSLAPTFSFDFSSIPDASGYYHKLHPELPVPWTWNGIECVCPNAFLPLPPGGVLHIGSVGVRLPTAPGVYRLDALNASHAAPELGQAGAMIYLHLGSPEWMTAFTGEITGGVFDFVVRQSVPTMSGGALLVLAVLLGSAGSWIAAREITI